MKIKFSDLWRWEGTVDRGPYLLIGVLGFILKYNIDRVMGSFLFDKYWDPWEYINYFTELNITKLLPADINFFLAMAVASLPFIWVGVVLTLRRLRAIGWPLVLVFFFFVPVGNLIFFLLLSIIPSRPSPVGESSPHSAAFLNRFIPHNTLGCAAFACGNGILIGLLMFVLSVVALSDYGWGLFVGAPFMVGLLAVLVNGYHQRRTLRSCMGVATTSILLLGLFIFGLAYEGFVCLLMALPIAIPLAWLGGLLGFLIQRGPLFRKRTMTTILLSLILSPSLIFAEQTLPRNRPLFAITSAIEISAPPEAVWEKVVAFSEIPMPTEWLFKIGIAYPKRATIHGQGPGATRYCTFTTGDFVEPIEIWDAPRRLTFGVSSQPAPMQEWTPYSTIDPPHLHGYFQSQKGEFLLTKLPNGGTRVAGTTWYSNKMWPQPYWKIWGDLVIHRIHMRVLEHIKTVAEKKI